MSEKELFDKNGKRLYLTLEERKRFYEAAKNLHVKLEHFAIRCIRLDAV